MTAISKIILFLVPLGTLVSHILFVLLLIGLIAYPEFRLRVYVFVYTHATSLLFVASLFAFVGSLAYSNIVGFPPCELCWIQRIFMYPQAPLSLIATIKKDKNIVTYLLPMSILGGLVALYHSLTSWGIGSSLLKCTSVGGECARVYVHAYGYITIPLMSFTVFAYLILISIIYYRAKKIYANG